MVGWGGRRGTGRKGEGGGGRGSGNIRGRRKKKRKKAMSQSSDATRPKLFLSIEKLILFQVSEDIHSPSASRTRISCWEPCPRAETRGRALPGPRGGGCCVELRDGHSTRGMRKKEEKGIRVLSRLRDILPPVKLAPCLWHVRSAAYQTVVLISLSKVGARREGERVVGRSREKGLEVEANDLQK